MREAVYIKKGETSVESNIQLCMCTQKRSNQASRQVNARIGYGAGQHYLG